jgi:hypothetical protein
MASTLLNEQGFAPDVIELQLAHAERNKVRAAYNRAQRLAERRKMMQTWSDYSMASKRPATLYRSAGRCRPRDASRAAALRGRPQTRVPRQMVTVPLKFNGQGRWL